MPRAILAFACGVGFLLGVAFCVAEESAIGDVQVGVNGHFKRGHWAEVKAVVRSGDQPLQGELEVISRDGDGAAAAIVCPQPVELEAGKSATFVTLVKMGPPRSGLQLRVRREERTLARFEMADAALSGEWNAGDKTWKKAHRSTALVIATLGPASGVESSLDQLHRSLGDEAAIVSLDRADQLPDTLRGYDSLDCLVVTAADENPLAAATPQRRDALLEWVQLGGKLVLSAGDSAEELFSSASPWSGVFVGRLTGRSPLATDAGLKNFAGEAIELTPPPQVWQINAPRATVLLSESGTGGDRPLIVAYPIGLGRVSLVLVDLTKPPLSQWSGRGRMWARIISSETLASEPEAVRSGGRMTHLGYRDLAGQLRMALDQYAGASPVHFYAVAGALLLYLMLLGPGEYFLLRKAAPRAMHLTWIVFPLLLVGFTGGAIVWGRTARGSAVKINHVEVVDIDLTRGRQRGTFWTGLFSPEAQSIALTARPRDSMPQAELAGATLAWQALPGEGLGGVDIAPLVGRFPDPYLVRSGDANQPASIDRLPLAMASSKMFAGNWWGTIPAVSDASQLRRGKLRELEGTFRVVAPVPLKNAFLAYGDLLYRARDELSPGAEIDVARLEHKHIEYFLTRKAVLKDREVASPWNQEEDSVPRIMDIMMFHGAVLGRNYTVLSHRYQGEIDLTHLLHQGYAVLVGRSDTPLVDLELAGEPLDEANVRRWTWYRILYPVAPRD